jgi:hypothetical protein
VGGGEVVVVLFGLVVGEVVVDDVAVDDVAADDVAVDDVVVVFPFDTPTHTKYPN